MYRLMEHRNSCGQGGDSGMKQISVDFVAISMLRDSILSTFRRTNRIFFVYRFE